ncbi:MAG: fumarylacetoacetate hydrolase family protein, partial [Chloroflexi bacterium]|nr:fumarylacetoacetate hydrolase family protein [Chloroflexota bacterium]
MKLVRFTDTAGAADSTAKPGLVKGDAVVDISSTVAGLPASTPQMLMESIIDNFESLRPELEKLLESGSSVPAASVKLCPPLPRPSKILCCIGNYWEHMQREPRPLNMFLKSPESIIGPGDTVVLPDFQAEVFQHEAELGIVIKGPAKDVSEADY